MTNPFLNNDSLKKFMNDVGVSVKTKKQILEKLPQMNAVERLDLFNMLKKLYIVQIVKQRTLSKVKKK